MRPIVTDRIVWSVGLSVCHNTEPCKNGWTDRDAVWVQDSGGSKEPCITWDLDLPVGRGNFEEKGRDRRSASSCAKMAEPIKMPFGLWTRVGPRKHVLHGAVHYHNLANASEPSIFDGPAKRAERIKLPLWGVDSCGPKEECIISQSIKIYFPSNDRKLQGNTYYSTRKATRKALRSL